MRVRLGLAAGGLLLVASALLLLVAADALRWESRLAADDIAFRDAPGRADLWRTRELAPGGAARVLLGLDDDLAFREAIRMFRLGRPRQLAYRNPALTAVRAEAQTALGRLARSEHEAHRRSEALNLLGVLSLGVEGRESAANRARFLESGIASFQTAVQLDERNERAKYNLELSLRKQDADSASLENAGTLVPRDDPSGAGVRVAGTGY